MRLEGSAWNDPGIVRCLVKGFSLFLSSSLQLFPGQSSLDSPRSPFDELRFNFVPLPFPPFGFSSLLFPYVSSLSQLIFSEGIELVRQ